MFIKFNGTELVSLGNASTNIFEEEEKKNKTQIFHPIW